MKQLHLHCEASFRDWLSIILTNICSFSYTVSLLLQVRMRSNPELLGEDPDPAPCLSDLDDKNILVTWAAKISQNYHKKC